MHCNVDTVVKNPQWYVVDIRPQDERFGELGFVPGSLWIPKDSPDFARQVTKLALEAPVVLYCLSGHRSDAAHQAITQRSPDLLLYSLEGGLLAWSAAGHPVSGLNHAKSNQWTPETDIFAQIRACFVAQMTETMLDNEDEDFENPMHLLEMSFKELHTSPQQASVQQWYSVLDKLAHMSKSKGTKLRVVQEHLDDFRNILPNPR